jgi:FKBP-type peptidyl-prolyl cis-trans isomerase FkpA
MKKLVLCLLSIWCLSTGCLKKETGCPPPKNIVAPQSEQQVIADYLAANNINATKHVSGLYYQIWQQGNGESPNNCSSIVINYTGLLSNGNKFDEGKNVAFTLGSLIEGWKKGLPLIQKGGKIKLYIPPSLGYGSSDIKDNNGVIVIPANSMLIFDISLLDFQ